MNDQLSMLAIGLALLGTGIVWLGIATVAKAMLTHPEFFGDQNRAATYAVLPEKPVTRLSLWRKFRTDYLGAIKWVVQPVGWVLVVWGLCAALLGIVDKLVA